MKSTEIKDRNGLSPEKSLEIISSALTKARIEFSRDAGAPLLIWGASVLLISGLVMLALHLTGNLNWHFLWFGIPVIGTPLMLVYNRNNEKKHGKATNPVASAIIAVWSIFGIFSVLYALCSFFFDIPNPTPIIILMLGMATSITGGITKTWSICILGIIAALGGIIICYTEWMTQATGILSPAIMMAIMSILLLVIPGLIYNRIGNKESMKTK